MNPPRDKAQWKAALLATTEALQRIEDQRLAAMTDEEALRIIMTLSTAGPAWRERPDWSGLVEQQAAFRRGRKQ